MERATLELLVGIFVAVGLVCLGYLSIKLGKLELVSRHLYEVEAEFDSASGLKAGAPVEIAGVEVGRIKAITLKDNRASVVLSIHDDVQLYDDTIASVKTRGIIGEKFISVSPGGSGERLRTGGKIRDTESGVDLEQLVGQFIHGNVGK